MMINNKPSIIEGGIHVDERGKINFVNNFSLNEIKRFYLTEHFDIATIRAWQLHVVEQRWFFCVEGSFDVRIAEIPNVDHIPDNPKVYRYCLDYEKPNILHIPSGYANGFRALEENSKLLIFADYPFGAISDDQVRFDKDLWTLWNE